LIPEVTKTNIISKEPTLKMPLESFAPSTKPKLIKDEIKQLKAEQ